MFYKLKMVAIYVLECLGDSGRRRFVATVVAMSSTYLLGYALDAQEIAILLDTLIGGFSGAWSSRTPQLGDGEQS